MERGLHPCNLCGGRDFATVYRGCPDRRHWLPGTFEIQRCRGCGLVRTHPCPSRASIAAYYPGAYVSFANGGTRGRSRLGALARLPYRLRYGAEPAASCPPRTGARVLDVGCGTGGFLRQLAALGWEVWGIEPSAEVAQAAVERLVVAEARIYAGVAEDADFAEGTFDLVTMWHVLEHLHDPKGVLAKAARWLRPGGTLRLAVPNIASLESRLFGRLWFGLDVPRHLHHFSRATVCRLLESCGFTVERIVPECQGSSLSGSVAHVADAVTRRRRQYRHSRLVYTAALPVASTVAALGGAAVLDISARKP